MKNKLVSVIVTTCKRPPEILKRALDSIIQQTYGNYEVIVIDDSPSTFSQRNEIKELVGNYSNAKISYIQNLFPMGACLSRNIGIEKSIGKYIAFLDDDDEWLPEKIEKQVAAMEASKAGMVSCREISIQEDLDKETIGKVEIHSGYVYKDLLHYNFCGGTSYLLFDKDCIVAVGKFDPRMESCQDYDLMLRIAKRYPVQVVDEPLVRFHVYGGERISNNYFKRIQGRKMIIRKNFWFLLMHPTLLSDRIDSLIPEYWSAGRNFGGLIACIMSIVVCPRRVKRQKGKLVEALWRIKHKVI